MAQECVDREASQAWDLQLRLGGSLVANVKLRFGVESRAERL